MSAIDQDAHRAAVATATQFLTAIEIRARLYLLRQGRPTWAPGWYKQILENEARKRGMKV